MYITLFPPNKPSLDYLLEIDKDSTYLVPCKQDCEAKRVSNCDGLNVKTHHDFLGMYTNGCDFEEVFIKARQKGVLYGKGLKIKKDDLPANFIHTVKNTAH